MCMWYVIINNICRPIFKPILYIIQKRDLCYIFINLLYNYVRLEIMYYITQKNLTNFQSYIGFRYGRNHFLLLCKPSKKMEVMCFSYYYWTCLKILLNYRLNVFVFWHEFKTLKMENINIYIIEEMLSVNFLFFDFENSKF